MSKLICEHKIHVTNIKEKIHVELLWFVENALCYTVVAAMLELSIIIEERIIREMKDRKGSIMYDG